jgi:tRNA threonylcarbamoyladenosine biosynthesis protein TsaB
MRILGIETALGFSEVALLDESVGGAPWTLADGDLYSENVIRLIRALLASNAVSLESLDAIAVSIGPGSFTGLRIGLSVAKGLAVSTNRPLVGVSTLDGLAGSAIYGGIVEAGEEFLAVVDAKRGDYYCAPYKSAGGTVLRTGDLRVMTLSGIMSAVPSNRQLLLAGNGRSRLEEQLSGVETPARSAIRVIEKSDAISPAAAVAILGLQKAQRQDFADIASLEPLYLKDFVIRSVN